MSLKAGRSLVNVKADTFVKVLTVVHQKGLYVFFTGVFKWKQVQTENVCRNQIQVQVQVLNLHEDLQQALIMQPKHVHSEWTTSSANWRRNNPPPPPPPSLLLGAA